MTDVGCNPRWRRLAAVLVLVVGPFPGCDAASDAGPPGNRIRVVDPTGRLAAHTTVIEQLARETLAAVQTQLQITGVTISIVPDPAAAIAGWGIGGFTPDAQTVTISLDPGFPDLAALLPARLPLLIAHELHHTVRHRQTGYGTRLFEAIVSEGMADQFAVQLLGSAVPPWSDALTDADAARLFRLAKAEFDRGSYDHPKWFFGTTSAVPRWTGYTLGYRLVGAYLADHPGMDAAKLVTVAATEFHPR